MVWNVLITYYVMAPLQTIREYDKKNVGQYGDRCKPKERVMF